MEKIKKLKQIFKTEKIDGYIIPKNDEFFGENTAVHKDRLKFISNFTGSFGFSIILRNENYLFVDGRYTLQANNQSGKFFKIVTFPNKMPIDILKKKKLVLGFDPKLFTSRSLKTFFNKTSCELKPLNKNLIDKIWSRKIKKNKNKFFVLPKSSVGIDYRTKLNKVVSYLKRKGGDFQFISASENNAWLLNIRGNDTEYSPIPHTYILINRKKEIKLFCDLKKISNIFKNKLKNIEFHEINSISQILTTIKNKKFLIDKNTCSFYFEKLILKNNKIINDQDPIYSFKAIKNKREIDNMKLAHIYDGSALTKYLFWLKKNFKKKVITELSGSQKLFQLRKLNKKFKFSSFPTISGTGPNSAIIHYNATRYSNRKLKNGDIYLVDSGGQYEYGTTDVTRTISLNNSSEKVKNIYTRVLKGHIAVANFKLKKNTSGSIIDNKARQFLKQIGLNYSHGTGHGVGYFLNVHEGPQAISKNNKIKLKDGMILSNEPGYYEKDKFGIRIENLVYIKKKDKKNCFENLTMAPIDKDLINKSLMNSEEKKWLNTYHQKVFQKLKNLMSKNELAELREACSAI